MMVYALHNPFQVLITKPIMYTTRVVLKQIPQTFEYSFVLQYSNTIYAIQLFVATMWVCTCIFFQPLGVVVYIIGLVIRT